MSEGKVTGWLKPPGSKVAVGEELLEVETEKIAGVVEAGDAGTLRRVIGEPDTVYPIKALLGVLADDDVPDADIDAFVAGYVTPAGDEAEGEEAGPRYEFVETPAGRLRYAKRGEGGEAIVLIHGFGGDLDNWLFNIDALAGAGTVYALDLPGHGQSEKSLRDASLKGLSSALLGFMDALGIEKGASGRTLHGRRGGAAHRDRPSGARPSRSPSSAPPASGRRSMAPISRASSPRPRGATSSRCSNSSSRIPAWSAASSSRTC
jgi:pyruvate dehydrogenase E2 component (dihydrolipoamide acetyltransferase)